MQRVADSHKAILPRKTKKKTANSKNKHRLFKLLVSLTNRKHTETKVSAFI